MSKYLPHRETQGAQNSPRSQSFLLYFLTVWMVTFPASLRSENLPLAPKEPHSSPLICTAHAPVTNECVEAGLRARRETIRAESGFHVKTPASHLQLAQRFNQQGDPNGAIEEYRAALQLDPNLSSAFLGLGAVYLDQHEWTQAEVALEQAAHLDSENGQTEYWLGQSRLAQHKFPEALAALKAALRLNPHDAEAFSDLGLTYMALGEPMNAISALRHAIRLQPDFSEAHARLELTETLKRNQGLLIEETARILELLFSRK